MKTNIVQAKAFLRDLFESQKVGKKSQKAVKIAKEDLIKISDRFTPEEYNRIVGEDSSKILDYAEKYNTPFIAELRPQTRNAILNMGSKSVYVDMKNTSAENISNMITDLIRHPYNV